MRRVLLFIMLMSFASGMNAQPYRYNFNNSLISSTGGPTLVEVADLVCGSVDPGTYSDVTITTSDGVCGASPRTVFNFNQWGGLSFPNSNLIGDTYTIHMLVEFDALTGFQRLIDFSDGAEDNGFYYSDDCIFIATDGPVGTCPGGFIANQYFLITLIRNGATDEVEIYVDGDPVYTYDDNAGLYVPTTSTTPITFFRDDAAFGCEAGSGSIKYLSISPTVSSNLEVAAEWDNICALILPLRLIDFSASKQLNAVQLKWSTESESNAGYFELQRSADGRNFSNIGLVSARNLATRNNYTFDDAQPLSGTSFYRLKMVDADGSFKYSGIVKITSSGIQPFEIFPNPVKDVFTVSGMRNNEVLRLMDASGKELLRRMATGMSLTIDISQYPTGVYYLSYFDGEKMQTRKILKQ